MIILMYYEWSRHVEQSLNLLHCPFYLQEYKPQVANAGLWAGGGVMLFGLTKGVYTVFTGFLSLTPYDMGWYFFWLTSSKHGVTLRHPKCCGNVKRASCISGMDSWEVSALLGFWESARRWRYGAPKYSLRWSTSRRYEPCRTVTSLTKRCRFQLMQFASF